MSLSEYTPDFDRMVNITILNSLGFFFLDFLIPFVATLEIEATGSQMGVIFSVRTMGYLAIALLVGSLADKMSSKKLVLVGSFGRGISYFLLYISIVTRSLTIMIAGNFLLGAMAGFFWIPFDMLVSTKSHQANRSEAFGKRTAAIGKGTLIGSILGFSALGYFNATQPGNGLLIYSPLIIYGVGNIIAGILFLTVDEQIVITTPVQKQESIGYRQFLGSLSHPYLIALLLMMVTLLLARINGSIAQPFILVYLTANLVQDATIASMVFIPSGIASMLLAPKMGNLVDRFNKKLVIMIGVSIGALTTLALISTQSLILFSMLLVVDVTVATATGLVVMNILSRLSSQHRGKIFGLQTLFTDLGGIFGPIVGGIFWDRYGQKSPFYFSIGVEFLLIPLMIWAIIRIQPFLEEKVEAGEPKSAPAET